MIQKFSALCLIGIMILLALLWRSCDRIDYMERQLSASSDTVKIWVDKYNRSNAEIQVLQSDYSSLKHELDSVKKLNIKPKKVQSVVNITKVVRDTVRLTNNVYVDRWSRFELLDTFKIAYSIRDSISLITYKRPYGFLNLKTKYVTRAVTFNPSAQLTGLRSVEIKPRPRKISLGLYAGYGLQLSQGVVRYGWSTGIGFNFRIL